MLIPACNAFSLSNFTNYQNVIKINDIVASGNKIWAASSGGLLLIDPKKNSQAFYSDIYSLFKLETGARVKSIICLF